MREPVVIEGTIEKEKSMSDFGSDLPPGCTHADLEAAHGEEETHGYLVTLTVWIPRELTDDETDHRMDGKTVLTDQKAFEARVAAALSAAFFPHTLNPPAIFAEVESVD